MKGRIIIFHIDCIFKHSSLSSGTKMWCKKTRKQMEKPFSSIWNVEKTFMVFHPVLIRELYIVFSLLLYNIFYYQATTFRSIIIKYYHIFSTSILAVMSSWFSLVFICLSVCHDISYCWHILDAVEPHACLGDRWITAIFTATSIQAYKSHGNSSGKKDTPHMDEHFV